MSNNRNAYIEMKHTYWNSDVQGNFQQFQGPNSVYRNGSVEYLIEVPNIGLNLKH